MRRPDPRVTHRRPELSQHFLREGAARALVRDLALPARRPSSSSPARRRGADRGAGGTRVPRHRDRAGRAAAPAAGGAAGAVSDVRCVRGDFLATALPASAVQRRLERAIRDHGGARAEAAARGAPARRGGAHRPAGGGAEVRRRRRAETLFSLLHKPWFEIDVVGAMRRSDFVPPPRVQSAVLRIRRRTAPLVAPRSSGGVSGRSSTPTFGHGAPATSRGRSGAACTATQVRRLGRDLGFAARRGHVTAHVRAVAGGLPLRGARVPGPRSDARAHGGMSSRGSPQRASSDSIFFGAPEGWRRKLWTSQRLKPSSSTSSMRARFGLSKRLPARAGA